MLASDKTPQRPSPDHFTFAHKFVLAPTVVGGAISRGVMTTNPRGALSAALIAVPLCGCLSNDEASFTTVRVPAGAEPGTADAGAPEVDTSAWLPRRVPARGAERTPELELALPLNPLATASNAGEPAPALMETEMEASSGVPTPGACDADGLIVCDDFESALPGLFPGGEAWLPELSGCGSHSVEELGVSRSGARALRAQAGGYPECMLHASVSLDNPIYVRSWVRLDASAASGEQYISLLELGPRDDRDDPELRIGVRPENDSLCPGVPGVDLSIGGLAGGPSTECSGVVLEQERWYCLQARVSMQGRRLTVSLEVDAQLAAEVTYAGLDAAWNARDLYFKLGRASYGGPAVGPVWHDDVALGSEPLPCGP